MMLKHYSSEGRAELQRGTTLIQETPGARQSYSCVAPPASLDKLARMLRARSYIPLTP